MKIFVICPVRGITETEETAIEKYVLNLENAGHAVHWPPRNTDQNDAVGLRICLDNLMAIEKADEIHIWWNSSSQGSVFDFGMAFALKKKIILVNKGEVEKTSFKSFGNVLLALDAVKESPKTTVEVTTYSCLLCGTTTLYPHICPVFL